jgi:hypothetical protein
MPVGVKPELYLCTIFHFLVYTEYLTMPWKFFLGKNYSTEDLVLLVPIYIVILGKYYSVQMFYFISHTSCSEACLFAFVIYLCCKIVYKLNCQFLIFFLCRLMVVDDLVRLYR